MTRKIADAVMKPRGKTLEWALAQTRKRPGKLGGVYDDIDRVTNLVYARLPVIRKEARLTGVSFYGTMLQYIVTWGQDVDHGVVDGVHRTTAAEGYGFYLGNFKGQARIMPYPGCAAMRQLPEDGWAVKDMTDDEIVDVLAQSLMWDMRIPAG